MLVHLWCPICHLTNVFLAPHIFFLDSAQISDILHLRKRDKENTMAIKNYKTGEVTYVGRVMSVTTSCERVMSDIYADVTKARVVKEDGSVGCIVLSYGFELCSLTLRGEADLHPYWDSLNRAWMAVHELTRELETAASRMSHEIFNARTETKLGLCALRKGDRLVVTRKCKGNANGDEGVVFWVGYDRFSGKLRYGFKTDAGETRWISAGSARNASMSMEAINAELDKVELEIRNKYAEREICIHEQLEAVVPNYEFIKSHLREFLAIAA